MRKPSAATPRFDMQALTRTARSQFHNLDPKDPSVWPMIPKALLCVGLAALVAFLAWWLHLSSYQEELEQAQAEEGKLREDYQKKLSKAVSLEGLKKQREQVQLYVMQLEKQLPGKAEMSALLSDINQAGLGRNLQFELFRPGAVSAKAYYAELPISVRVSGNYHDIGAFASDIAYLSRIVTLNNITLVPAAGAQAPAGTAPAGGKVTLPGSLVMDATVRTFRYLDTEEIASQQAAQAKKGGK